MKSRSIASASTSVRVTWLFRAHVNTMPATIKMNITYTLFLIACQRMTQERDKAIGVFSILCRLGLGGKVRAIPGNVR